MKAELRRAVSSLPGPLPEPVLTSLSSSDERGAFTAALAGIEKVRRCGLLKGSDL